MVWFLIFVNNEGTRKLKV